MIFKDRIDAAKMLIPFLEKFSTEKCVVLAIPRGGVPLGSYIARHFGYPLEVVLSKKIGHPMNSEYAVGAVSLDNRIVDSECNLPQSYIEDETVRIRRILSERQKLYTGNRNPVDLKDKTVIIVDDGIATGNTMALTIQLLRKQEPKKIIVAVPVAPPDAARYLEELSEEFICLETPEDFNGVGQFYNDFSEVSDEKVKKLLDEAHTQYIASQ